VQICVSRYTVEQYVLQKKLVLYGEELLEGKNS